MIRGLMFKVWVVGRLFSIFLSDYFAMSKIVCNFAPLI